MSDDDLEARLRRTLAARADQAPPPGPVEQRTLAAVRQAQRQGQRGSRRRAGWFGSAALRPVAVAASVLIVVGATAGGVALVRNLTHGSGTGTKPITASSQPAGSTARSTDASTSATVSAPPPITGSAAPTSATPTSATSTSATSVEPTTGRAPKGLAVTDLTFVTSEAGWALGTVTACARKPCTSLVRTTDGGKTWVGLRPPAVDLAGTKGCAGTNCVSSVRFANASIGYLYGPRTLYITKDGGTSWTHLPGGADALEIAAGNVLRVTSTVADCRPACTYLVQTSDVGGTSWRTVLTAAGSGNGAALVRAGTTAYVQVYSHPAGGAQSAHTSLYSSTDAGQNWAPRGEPCPQLSGASVEYDATALAPSPTGSVAVLCQPRTSGHDPFLATSSGAGRAFVAGAPNAELSPPISAASAEVVFATAAASGRTAGRLLRSTNGGKTWAVAVTAPAGSTFGGLAFGFLGFENTTTGRWVSASDPETVWTTRDAGATWSPHAF